MLVWRAPDRLFEGAREIRWTQVGFACELVDRYASIEAGVDELEDTRPRCGGQSASHSHRARRVDANVLDDLQAQARSERFHEWKAARVAAIGFGDERPYEMFDLGRADIVDTT